GVGSTTPASAPPGIRRIEGPDAQPVDLLSTAGTPVAKRLVPLVAGLLILLLIWRLRRRRA
ncbi:MAG: carbon monoxide dehydrogenase, partial [Acidimicrobiales bacterium]